MASGIEKVDASKHVLENGVLIRPGEALGHGYWIDRDFCAKVHELANGGKNVQSGLKARFGHPNMCSDSLGTFLGRWKDITVDASGFVRGNLFLSSTAAESPKGDLRNYVEEMAAKEPQHFGASIVFTQDWEAFDAFYEQHTVEEPVFNPEGKQIGVRSVFKSPDPNNVKNLPHARCAELHAADLVDDPAATDGMFSGVGGTALAAEMTEFLDLHPEVFAALQDPKLVTVLERYSTELKPFIDRYQANQKALGCVVQTTTTVWTDEKPKSDGPQSDAAAESADTPNREPAESGELQARIDVLTAEVGTANASIQQLTVERDGAVTRAQTAEASNTTLCAERDRLAEQLKQSNEATKAALAERDDAKQKLGAYLSGQEPATSTAAEKQSERGNMFDDARKTKRK